MLESVQNARAAMPSWWKKPPPLMFPRPGSVTSALKDLRMATVLGKYPSERVALEPWLVRAALARLGDRRLTRVEQQEVVQAMRTPKKVA